MLTHIVLVNFLFTTHLDPQLILSELVYDLLMMCCSYKPSPVYHLS